jgi:hypothetical protein
MGKRENSKFKMEDEKWNCVGLVVQIPHEVVPSLK